MSSARTIKTALVTASLFVGVGQSSGQSERPIPTPSAVATPRQAANHDPSAALLRVARRDAWQTLGPGERAVMIQAMCVRVPSGFLERAGVTANDGKDPVLTPREARMLTALIHAEPDKEILTRPQLTLNDGQTGFSQCGETVAVVTGLEASEKNGTTVYTAKVEKVETGSTLRVTPKVSADGSVRLRIEPQCADISRTGGLPLPVTNARRTTGKTPADKQPICLGAAFNIETLQSTVVLPDGGTVVVPMYSTSTKLGKDQKPADLLWIVTAHVIRGYTPDDETVTAPAPIPSGK